MGNEHNSTKEIMVKAIGSFIRMNYPDFSKEGVTPIPKGDKVVYLYNTENEFVFCAVMFEEKTVMLNGKVIAKLLAVFGCNFKHYFINWFNNEFDQDIIQVC